MVTTPSGFLGLPLLVIKGDNHPSYCSFKPLLPLMVEVLITSSNIKWLPSILVKCLQPLPVSHKSMSYCFKAITPLPGFERFRYHYSWFKWSSPLLVFAYLLLSDYHHPGFFVITALAFCVTPAELLILNDYHPAWFQAPPRPWSQVISSPSLCPVIATAPGFQWLPSPPSSKLPLLVFVISGSRYPPRTGDYVLLNFLLERKSIQIFLVAGITHRQTNSRSQPADMVINKPYLC